MKRLIVLFILLASVAEAKAKAPAKLTVPKDQLALIKENYDALVTLAQKSATAKKQLELYDAYASVGRFEPTIGGMRVVEAPKSAIYFIVSADTRPKSMGKGDKIAAQFLCYPIHAMLLTHYEMPAFSKSVLLSHEIEHARDCLLNGEPNTKPLSDAWLPGELRAHAVVYHVLEEWSGGEWSKLVRASRDRRLKIAFQKGVSPSADVFAALPEDMTEFTRIFGVSDDVSFGILASQLDVDANQYNLRQSASMNGWSQARTERYILDSLGAFYRTRTQHAH